MWPSAGPQPSSQGLMKCSFSRQKYLLSSIGLHLSEEVLPCRPFVLLVPCSLAPCAFMPPVTRQAAACRQSLPGTSAMPMSACCCTNSRPLSLTHPTAEPVMPASSQQASEPACHGRCVPLCSRGESEGQLALQPASLEGGLCIKALLPLCKGLRRDHGAMRPDLRESPLFSVIGSFSGCCRIHWCFLSCRRLHATFTLSLLVIQAFQYLNISEVFLRGQGIYMH